MSASLQELEALRQVLGSDLGKVERVMGEVEAQYLQADYSQVGHVLKGFDGLLSSKENLRKRARSKLDEKADERAFSLSSKTSPATMEQGDGVYDGGAAAAIAAARKPGYAQKGYAQKRYGEKGR